MGLFMDNQGIPITYELFPGNTNDCLTYPPNLGRINTALKESLRLCQKQNVVWSSKTIICLTIMMKC